MGIEKPTCERAPIRVIELGAGRRHGSDVDDAPDQLAALGAPRRYSREIDPATAARIVAAAAYTPHDRLDHRLPARVVIVRSDGQPGGAAAGADHQVAAGQPEHVICGCGPHAGGDEHAGLEQRDAAAGDDPQA